MTVQIFWDNAEHTIIRCVYEGHITAQDYYTAIDQSAEMMQTVPHPVNSINHRQNVLSLPPNLTQIMRYANRKLPANSGVQVIIGARYFTQIMVNIGASLAPNLVKRVFFANTVAEAHALIAKHTLEPKLEA